MMSDGSKHFEPREERHRVKFKACLMRGADYHITIGHKFRFDWIMRRSYGVESKEHCHSFVELDLGVSEQLRMWWVLRRTIEAELLKHKVFAELMLLFTVALVALMFGFAIMWYGILGHPIALQFRVVWESIFLAFVTLRLVKTCAKLNSILESDSKRLSAIYTDLVQDSNREGTIDGAVQGTTSYQAGGGPNDSGVGYDCNHSASRRCTLRLLKVYIDHLDRDHRPLQLCGITINHQFLSRGYLLVFSGVCTGIVHLTARILRMNVDDSF